MHNLRPLFVIWQVLLVDWLDRYKLSGQLVHAEIDFTKGTTTEHFASPVKISRSLRCFTSFIEWSLDAIRDANHLDDTWGDLSLCRFWAFKKAFGGVLVERDVASDILTREFATSESFFGNVDRDRPLLRLGFVLHTVFRISHLERVCKVILSLAHWNRSVILSTLSSQFLLGSSHLLHLPLLQVTFITLRDCLWLLPSPESFRDWTRRFCLCASIAGTSRPASWLHWHLIWVVTLLSGVTESSRLVIV